VKSEESNSFVDILYSVFFIVIIFAAAKLHQFFEIKEERVE